MAKSTWAVQAFSQPKAYHLKEEKNLQDPLARCDVGGRVPQVSTGSQAAICHSSLNSPPVKQ